MKKSELRQIIKEEIQKVLNESITYSSNRMDSLLSSLIRNFYMDMDSSLKGDVNKYVDLASNINPKLNQEDLATNIMTVINTLIEKDRNDLLNRLEKNQYWNKLVDFATAQ